LDTRCQTFWSDTSPTLVRRARFALNWHSIGTQHLRRQAGSGQDWRLGVGSTGGRLTVLAKLGRMNRQLATAKLRGLSGQLNSLAIQNQRVRQWPAEWVINAFERYYSIRDALQASEPDLFGDLPVRPMPQQFGEHEGESDYFISAHDFTTLRSDIAYCLTVLDDAPSAEGVLVTLEKEGLFINGQVYDAFQQIVKIIESGSSSIKIIDGYADAKLLNMLTYKGQGVEVQLLTKPASSTSGFKAAVEAFSNQYPTLSVRLSDAFHDRFVIIDDTSHYHFGASLKDAGKRGSMFSLLEEPAIIDALRASFVSEWARSTPFS